MALDKGLGGRRSLTKSIDDFLMQITNIVFMFTRCKSLIKAETLMDVRAVMAWQERRCMEIDFSGH